MTYKKICDRFGLDAEDYIGDDATMASDLWKKIRRDPGYGKTFNASIDRQWESGVLYYDYTVAAIGGCGIRRIQRCKSRSEAAISVVETLIEWKL